ncbi:MAG: hypothetical protein MK110_05175 [Fuerstiella sp.]|nr:hypothetical protein [Fuerstiella sp.]
MTVLRGQSRRSAYHVNAYQFVFAALQYAQEKLGRDRGTPQAGHISGEELLDGVREMALRHFGLMAKTVLAAWGITTTEDFGRIVFELIESGRMRKTEDDRLEDFVDVYDFGEAFENEYEIDTSVAFRDHPARI